MMRRFRMSSQVNESKPARLQLLRERGEMIQNGGKHGVSFSAETTTSVAKKDQKLKNDDTIFVLGRKGSTMGEEKIEVKVCRKCGQVKPLTKENYVPNDACKGGFEGTCKKCKSEQGKQRRRENKEGVKTDLKVEKPVKELKTKSIKLKAKNSFPPVNELKGFDVKVTTPQVTGQADIEWGIVKSTLTLFGMPIPEYYEPVFKCGYMYGYMSRPD
jgi:hypothetical protein